MARFSSVSSVSLAQAVPVVEKPAEDGWNESILNEV